MSRANGGLIQRDARKAQRARDVLLEIPIDDLIARVGRAGELYMNATLPMGDGMQTADEFVHAQSASTGLPERMCRANMKKNAFVLGEMRSILDGQYGAPEVEIESYAYPFGEGKHVGFETTALRVGKARIGAMWQSKDEALGLRISERLIVSAHYESPSWKQEVDRRAQRGKTGL